MEWALQYLSSAGGAKLEDNGCRLGGWERSVIFQVHLCVCDCLGSCAVILLVDHMDYCLCRYCFSDGPTRPGNGAKRSNIPRAIRWATCYSRCVWNCYPG